MINFVEAHAMYNEEQYQAIPDVTNISEFVTHFSASKPENIALIDGYYQWTYEALEEEIDTLAKAMMANGVKIGDRICCLSLTNHDYFITLMATARIGGIWIGLDPSYSLAKLEHVYRDASPSIIFYQAPIAGRDFQFELSHLRNIHPVQIIRFGTTSRDYIGTFISEFIRTSWAISIFDEHARTHEILATSPTLLVYDFDTEDKPKGALIHHASLIESARIRNTFWHADPVRMINHRPISDLGCISEISLFVLASSGTQIMMPKFDPINYNELMERHKCTIWCGLPSTFQSCLEDPAITDYQFPALQKIVWSGSAISKDQLERLKTICPNLSSAYGHTVSPSSLCYTREGDSDEVYLNTIGKPIDLYETRIMKKNAQPAEIGEVGEIQYRGDHLLCDYLNQQDTEASSSDSDGWFKTGDLGVMRADGNIVLIGRLQDKHNPDAAT